MQQDQTYKYFQVFQYGMHLSKIDNRLVICILLLNIFRKVYAYQHSLQYMGNVRNALFIDIKILEPTLLRNVVESKLKCALLCIATPSCLSMGFNDVSKICLLFDRDFVEVAETKITPEIGWNYFFAVHGL